MQRVRRYEWGLIASVGMALLVGSLFGCAGVMVIVRGSSDFQLEKPAFASQRTLSSNYPGLPATAEHFLRDFGEPDEVLALGPRREQWRYRTRLRFHGVALLLIVVPLPLFIPTGFHNTYVEIEQGIVVQVRGSQNSVLARFGCMFGPIVAMFGDGGCVARRGLPPNRARLGSGVLWLGSPPTLRTAPTGP